MPKNKLTTEGEKNINLSNRCKHVLNQKFPVHAYAGGALLQTVPNSGLWSLLTLKSVTNLGNVHTLFTDVLSWSSPRLRSIPSCRRQSDRLTLSTVARNKLFQSPKKISIWRLFSELLDADLHSLCECELTGWAPLLNPLIFKPGYTRMKLL